jgi:hypothetical protein
MSWRKWRETVDDRDMEIEIWKLTEIWKRYGNDRKRYGSDRDMEIYIWVILPGICHMTGHGKSCIY